jgi:hypothetical protein
LKKKEKIHHLISVVAVVVVAALLSSWLRFFSYSSCFASSTPVFSEKRRPESIFLSNYASHHCACSQHSSGHRKFCPTKLFLQSKKKNLMITISCSAPKVFTGEHFNFFKNLKLNLQLTRVEFDWNQRQFLAS